MQELRDDVRRGHEVFGVHHNLKPGVHVLPGKHVAKPAVPLGDVVQERGGLRRERRQDGMRGMSPGPGRDRVVSRLRQGYVPERRRDGFVQALPFELVSEPKYPDIVQVWLRLRGCV